MQKKAVVTPDHAQPDHEDRQTAARLPLPQIKVKKIGVNVVVRLGNFALLPQFRILHLDHTSRKSSHCSDFSASWFKCTWINKKEINQ